MSQNVHDQVLKIYLRQMDTILRVYLIPLQNKAYHSEGSSHRANHCGHSGSGAWAAPHIKQLSTFE
jgi:hypothetical protein